VSSWGEFLPHLYQGAIALFVVVVVAVGVGLLHLRHAKLDRYYIMREEARRKGTRWLLAATVSFIVGVVLLCLYFYPPVTPAAPQSPLPPLSTATAAGVTPLPKATLTPSAVALPSPTPTRRPTATPPFIPTPTPAYPLPETALSPLPGAVQADPEAQITFRTFALGEENNQPVDPGLEFPAGDHRVYFFFEYEGMRKDVVWTFGWYKDGEYLDGNTCLWGRDIVTEFGRCPPIPGSVGVNYLYLRPPGGYEPGLYEVRVWIEDRLQVTAQFVVQ